MKTSASRSSESDESLPLMLFGIFGCTGTSRTLAGWPGSSGHELVKGSTGSWYSVSLLSRYCITREKSLLQVRCDYTYIVPIRSAHHQSAVTARGPFRGVAIAGDVLENMASSPVVIPCLSIPAELVGLAEVVPGPKELNGEDIRRSLTMEHISLVSVEERSHSTTHRRKVIRVVEVDIIYYVMYCNEWNERSLSRWWKQ